MYMFEMNSKYTRSSLTQITHKNNTHFAWHKQIPQTFSTKSYTQPLYFFNFSIVCQIILMFPILFQNWSNLTIKNDDGGWGIDVESHSFMFCTVINYICLRIFGVDPDHDGESACARARKWIIDHGGATYTPLFGKAWLSVCCIYNYQPNNQSWFSLWFSLIKYFQLKLLGSWSIWMVWLQTHTPRVLVFSFLFSY